MSEETNSFFGKVSLQDKCWGWLGTIQNEGYGIFHYKQKRVRAHRWAYEYFKGPIPKGMELDHLCRNRACVNPIHLEAVTHKENILRGMGIAAKLARQEFCKRGHPLKGDNLVKSKLVKRQRICRICQNNSNKEYMARKKSRVSVNTQ